MNIMAIHVPTVCVGEWVNIMAIYVPTVCVEGLMNPPAYRRLFNSRQRRHVFSVAAF